MKSTFCSRGAVLAAFGLALLGIALGCSRPTAALDPEDKAPAKPDTDAPKATAKADAASDWSMFGGSPQRNLVDRRMKNPPTDFGADEGKGKNVKWAAELGDASYGGPVVAGGKVFIGTNNKNPRNPKIKGDKGVLMCFDAQTGKFLWQAIHDKLPDPNENDYPFTGICSSPIVEGNRLYYVSNRCELICADTEGMADGNQGVQDEKHKGATDADIIWRLDMVGKLGVFPCFMSNCSPLIAGDLVYVCTSNGTDTTGKHPAPKAPSFVAVDKKTGEVKWQSNLPGDKIMEGQWSNPTYAEVGGKGQVIFGGGDGWLYSFEAKTGNLIWKFDGNPKKSVYKPAGQGTRNYLVGTPVVHDNKLYVGMGRNPEEGAGEAYFWCIDLTKTGDISPVNDNFDPKAAENKNSGLVWHYGGPIVPKPERGRAFYFGRTVSTCAVADGLIYAAELDGFLHCFDAATGKKYWEHDLVAGCWNSPMWIDGKVYLGADDGSLHIMAASKEKKLLAKLDLGGLLKGPPVAANGMLYVMTDKYLYAIAGK